MTQPILYIVVPCYNEEAVLPITGPMFLEKLRELTESGQIREESRVLFVNDGSKDACAGRTSTRRGLNSAAIKGIKTPFWRD